ncbi:MAG: VWA domain-containing protein [Caldilineaceae bacterium]|nr:VWA domain-containing protein [Caldilineaceae bacterium]
MNAKLLYLSRLILGLSLLLFALSNAAPLFAADAAQTAVPTGPATEPIDVVVLLDDSGSMATCWPWPREGLPTTPPCNFPSVNQPSDPDELRYSAARLLIHLADEADRIAVVRFDSQAEGVGALGAMQSAGGSENRRRLAASLEAPTNYYPRGYTRMDLGLAEAIRLLDATRQPNRSQYVLLLTDGEPTADGTLPLAAQKQTIRDQFEQLRAAGVLVFPVVLCNPTSGCSGAFLKDQSSTALVRDAANAPELLRVFSELFAEMKSDRSVVTSRDANGSIAFTTRQSQGVQEIAVVSPRAALSAVRQDGNPALTASLLNDGNVELNAIAGSVTPGNWSAETSDLSAFAVIRAASYPELLFPPPSALSSPASTRYYPAGKQPLLVVRGAGPAAGEALLLDGRTPIPTFGKDAGGVDALGAIPYSTASNEVVIQLGDDATPLQLRRTFHLEGRADLPRLEVFTPRPDDPGLLDDGRARLQAGFGPGLPVEGLVATAYVSDITDDENGVPVFQGTMTCIARLCINADFTPADGRSYRVTYLVSAVADGVRFGDWAEATLNVEPAVYLRGLPSPIDLNRMPAGGWPITVGAGTAEEIGTLTARLSLRRADTGEAVSQAALNFEIDVPESDTATGYLRVEGLDLLRPGDYTGEIELAATTPTGLPMDVKIRPAPLLPVSLSVARSAARVQSQVADFGEVKFNTSPNFRINEETRLPVTFDAGKPFRLTAALAESSCVGLSLTSGDLQADGDRWLLPVQLVSQTPVLPGGCSGQIVLAGPSEDFDIFPPTVEWRLQIRGVEWSVVGDLNFGDVGRAGERSTQPLLLRFDGSTPFVVQVEGIAAAGETGDGITELDESFLESASIEVNGQPNADGFYEIPVALVARKAIPQDPLRGSFYSGDITLGIEGLPGAGRSVAISFRSPTAYQRYVEWWLRPIYSLPLLLCTGPLSLLLLLIFVARARNRGYGEEEEPLVTLPQPDFLPEPANAFVNATFVDAASAETASAETNWESQWGNTEWGFGGGAQRPPVSSPAATNGNASGAGDPWKSGW